MVPLYFSVIIIITIIIVVVAVVMIFAIIIMTPVVIIIVMVVIIMRMGSCIIYEHEYKFIAVVNKVLHLSAWNGNFKNNNIHFIIVTFVIDDNVLKNGKLHVIALGLRSVSTIDLMSSDHCVMLV